MAAIAVLLFHGSYGKVSGGMAGVDLFFVLSGYLITGLLLAEYQAYGRIWLVNFYVRRFLRLYPALVLTVLATLLLNWCAAGLLSIKDERLMAIAPLLYFSNLIPGQYLGPLSHCWTLAVEEHFYLLWPPILYLCLRRRASVSLLVLTAVSVAMSLGLRVYWYSIGAEFGGLDPYRFTLFRLDAIMAGCMIAVLPTSRCPRVVRVLGSLISLAVGLSVFVAIVFTFTTAAYGDWFASVVILVTCMLIVASAAHAPNVAGLGNRWSGWVGSRSYGIYLYHQPIFLALEPLRLVHNPVNFLAVSTARFLLTFLAAEVSYQLVERHVLKLKHRFSAKALSLRRSEDVQENADPPRTINMRRSTLE